MNINLLDKFTESVLKIINEKKIKNIVTIGSSSIPEIFLMNKIDELKLENINMCIFSLNLSNKRVGCIKMYNNKYKILNSLIVNNRIYNFDYIRNKKDIFLDSCAIFLFKYNINNLKLYEKIIYYLYKNNIENIYNIHLDDNQNLYILLESVHYLNLYCKKN